MSDNNATKPGTSVRVEDGYWTPYQRLVRNTVLPYQWEALHDRIAGAEPSRAIANFRIAAGLQEGRFEGFVFQDTDLYKWLEAASYQLGSAFDPELERQVEEAARLIGAAQQADGYLNTYFTVAEPGKRWTNLADCHELYSAGHFIEAAAARYSCTGKTDLLNIAVKLADHIDFVFGPEPGKLRGYDGHQEIELALVRLYEATGERKYLDLAGFFIDERGQKPDFFHLEWEKRGRTSHWHPGVQKTPPSLHYHQAHLPVREQETAVGHAVRAVYMYAAMADLARLRQDEGLLAACRKLWSSIVHKQMYVTGGIGSTPIGEAFTIDYDLPNDTNYSETCASIGLIFFARRMLLLEVSSEYGDIMELALYNTVSSGMSADGKHYFYVNPMEVWPEASRGNPGKHHIKTERQAWYGCACCPPNTARLLSSLGHYIFTSDNENLYVHLYIGSEAEVQLVGGKAAIKLESGIPWKPEASLTITDLPAGNPFSIALRMPAWSSTLRLEINGQEADPDIRSGYAYLYRRWEQGDVIDIGFAMEPRRIYSHPQLRADVGKVALQRGPMIYCLEEADNEAPLAALSLPSVSEITEVPSEWSTGAVLLQARGERLRAPLEEETSLYRHSPPVVESCKLTFVPYALWGNRRSGEMAVWLRESL